MFVQKGKRSISFLCCLALLLSLVSGIPPATAESTVSKITAELQAVLDDMGDGDTVPIYVWIGDICYDEVEEEIKEEIGFGREDFAIEQDGYGANFLKPIYGRPEAMVIDDPSNPFDWEKLANEEYYELVEDVDTYIDSERVIAREKYNALLEDFSKKHLTDADIIFQSEYAPMFIYETTKAGVAALEALDQVIHMDLCVELELNDSNLNVAITNIDGDFTKDTMGLRGEGVTIGMIETYVPRYGVDLLKDSNIIPLTTNQSGIIHADAGLHAALVASIMVGSGGVVPDAQLVATGMDATRDGKRPARNTYERIERLIGRGSNVINMSAGFEVEGEYDAFAKWVDHIAPHHNVSFVAAAGNSTELGGSNFGSYVDSPATAYNVITVGSYRAMANPSNDILADFSCYVTEGDRANKPDVIAPGDRFNLGIAEWRNAKGTSYSAPMVTGVIAQLMQARPELKTRPDLIKATIMASSHRKVLNTNGTKNPVLGWSHMQGAGAIDARNAVFAESTDGTIAADDSVHTVTVFEGEDEYDSVFFKRGDPVSMALTWTMQHKVTLTPHTSGAVDESDIKLANLDLEVYDYRGTQVAISASKYNSAEFVHFTPESDQPYKIIVRRGDEDERAEDVKFAVAWSQPKFKNLNQVTAPRITTTHDDISDIGIGDTVTVEIKSVAVSDDGTSDDDTQDETIYYTTDGTVPLPSPNAYTTGVTHKYTGPFEITSENPASPVDIHRSIRAVSVNADGEASGYAVKWIRFRYRPMPGINYNITDVVAYATSPGHGDYGINLTREALVIPNDFVPAKYSVDGGKKWKEIKPANQALDNNKNPFNHNAKKGKNNFAKLLSKNLDLRISDGTQEIVFPPIKAPAKVKYAIDYAQGQFASQNGDWVLTLKKENDVKKDVLIARAGVKDRYSPDKAGKELVKYDFKERKEVPGEFAWGRFHAQNPALPDDIVNGITLDPFNGKKVTKWTYFVRSAPSSNAAGTGDFVAAGKIQKVSPTSLRKAPNLKIKNGSVKTKKNMFYNFMPAPDNTIDIELGGVPIDSTNFELKRGVYEFWFGGGKKAPSAKQTLP